VPASAGTRWRRRSRCAARRTGLFSLSPGAARAVVSPGAYPIDSPAKKSGGGGSCAAYPEATSAAKASASATSSSTQSTLYRPRRGCSPLRPWPSWSYVCTATRAARSADSSGRYRPMWSPMPCTNTSAASGGASGVHVYCSRSGSGVTRRAWCVLASLAPLAHLGIEAHSADGARERAGDVPNGRGDGGHAGDRARCFGTHVIW
jgi:hypothetical protein